MRNLLGILTLILVAAPTVSADTKDKTPVERTTNDRQIIDTLAEIHDQGAALFSSGDPAGCFRMFQGGLIAVRILLPKDLQQIVDSGMTEAGRIPSMSGRAMRLHELIEDVRKKLRVTAGPKVKGTLLNPPRPVGTSTSTIEPVPMPNLDKPAKKADTPIGPPIVVPVQNPPKGAPAPVTTAPASDDPPLLPFVPKIPNPDGK